MNISYSNRLNKLLLWIIFFASYMGFSLHTQTEFYKAVYEILFMFEMRSYYYYGYFFHRYQTNDDAVKDYLSLLYVCKCSAAVCLKKYFSNYSCTSATVSEFWLPRQFHSILVYYRQLSSSSWLLGLFPRIPANFCFWPDFCWIPLINGLCIYPFLVYVSSHLILCNRILRFCIFFYFISICYFLCLFAIFV